MRAIHRHQNQPASNRGPGGSSSSSSGGYASQSGPLVLLLLPRGTPALPRRADPRLDGAVCDACVALMCRYAPGEVLAFLLRHTAYDVRRCLAAVQEAGPAARGAHAYLLERLGDLSTAFQLHISDIQE